jgi:hypothetical protein
MANHWWAVRHRNNLLSMRFTYVAAAVGMAIVVRSRRHRHRPLAPTPASMVTFNA